MESSLPINIPEPVLKHTRSRSLSEKFDALSAGSKDTILGMTNGVRPSLNIPIEKQLPVNNRSRFDSADFSPVTNSILKFHGITHKIEFKSSSP